MIPAIEFVASECAPFEKISGRINVAMTSSVTIPDNTGNVRSFLSSKRIRQLALTSSILREILENIYCRLWSSEMNVF